MSSKTPLIQSAEAWDATADVYAGTGTVNVTTAFAPHCVEITIKKLSQDAKDIKCLELASGPGFVATAVAEELKERGTVIATDFSPKMIEQAQKRIKEMKLSNIESRVMDAQNLSFPDETFDFVFFYFGIFCLPNPEQSVKEIFRVLKKGGKVVVATWPSSPMAAMLGSSIKKFLQANPTPLNPPPSLRFSKKEEMEELFSAVGLSPEVMTVTCPTSLSSEDLVSTMMSNPGAIEAFGRDFLNKFVAALPGLLKEEWPTGKIELQTDALISIGTKP